LIDDKMLLTHLKFTQMPTVYIMMKTTIT